MDPRGLENRRLTLEREKLSLEKAKLNASHTDQGATTFKKHFGTILTALVSFIAVLVTGTQIYTAHVAKSNELRIEELRRAADDERQWRVALLDFLAKHRQDFFSQSESQRDQVFLMLEVSFPPRYADSVRSKLRLATAIHGQSKSNDASLEVLDRLLALAEAGELRGLERKAAILEGLLAKATRKGAATSNPKRKRVLEELLVPLVSQLNKSKKAFDQWASRGLYLDVQTIRDSNVAARDLLISKASLIPPELQTDALRLVEHYDAWLQAFERARPLGREPGPNEPFAMPAAPGYPFPRDAERRVNEVYAEYQNSSTQPTRSPSSRTKGTE
jgi:hypothetical protein